MEILFGIAIVVAACFCFVLLYGAPYVPTLTPQVKEALELADLRTGQTLLELGCGDGKVLIAAAKQGINSIGYELNPIMALIAWIRTYRYRQNVRVICGNFWTTQLPECDAIFVFLLDKYMKRLDTKIVQECRRPVKLVSFAFQIPDKDYLTISKGVYLYTYDVADDSRRNLRR